MSRPRETAADAHGRTVRLTNLDRLMWPSAGFTKHDLIRYYREVAPALLPHISRRAVTLARFPEGIDGPGWYQANCRGQPPWMTTHDVPARTGETLRYCVVDDLPALVWVANQGTVELHPFPWRLDAPDRAPTVIFDMDPGTPAGLPEACRTGLLLRDALEELGLVAFPKTSGSKGLHVIVPLNGEDGFPAVKAFAREVAREIAADRADLVTERTARRDRRGKVLLDWLQNDPGRSIVAPYSLRAAPVPRVSTPVDWDEVAGGAEEEISLRFSPEETLGRVDRMGDLLGPALEVRQRLPGT